MIELHRISISSGSFRLGEIQLAVPSGVYGVLMGKTGSGKTTILEATCGLRAVSTGQVRLHGRDVTCLPPAARGIGYVPQDLALFPTLTVREHLEFALTIRRAEPKVIRERVSEMAELLGIGALLGRLPAGLSGGESQRVALGRALSFHPPVLLLDEPLSALDEETRHDMYALLRRVQKQTGVTALHVTHSRLEAMALAQKLYVLEEGRIRELAVESLSPK